jgi:2-hydroxychromene-2-carboxylate isomerase
LGLRASVENYYGVPAVFFASTVSDELAEQINNEFKSFPPTLIGAQVTGNNAEFEEYVPVDIRRIAKNVGMENIKVAAEKILEKLDQTILKTEIHEPSHEYDTAYVYFQLK